MTPGESLLEATTRIMRNDACSYHDAKREAERQVMEYRLSSAKTLEDIKGVLAYILKELQ